MADGRIGRFLVYLFIGISIFYISACNKQLASATEENNTTEKVESPHSTESLSAQIRTKTPERAERTIVASTAVPENTQSPTKRASIGPTRTPMIFPSIEEAVVKPGYDLLFLSSGELRLWSRLNGSVTPLLQFQGVTAPEIYQGKVIEFALDRQNQRIVLLRSRGIAANGVELFNLEMLDIATGVGQVLLEETPAVHGIAVSPDGEWVTYSARIQDNETIYILSTRPDSEPDLIGSCLAESKVDWCTLNWMEAGSQGLWNDGEGVWLLSPPDFAPEKIRENFVQLVDSDGEEIMLEVRFSDLSLSPKGRYLLATVQPMRSEIRWQAILDIFRGRVSEVPGTYRYTESAASAAWMPGGELAVAQIRPGELGAWKKITIYGVFPTNEDLLINELEFDFKVVDPLNLANELMEASDYTPEIVLPENERKLWIMMMNAKQGFATGLYEIDLKYRSITKAYPLPAEVLDYHWTPEAAEAILAIKSGGSYFYFNKSSQTIYNLEAIFGEESCCFQWIP